MSTFRAIWPITERLDERTLIAQATADLPLLAAQAHARITGPGRWSIAPSDKVPGSGRATPTVLVYDAPAVEARPRSYWKAS